jgi:hypothetical protein
LPAAVGVALDDQFVAGADEAVDGGLCQERVGHQGEPLVRLAVGGDDRGGLEVPFDDDLVEVGGLGGVQRLEAQVIHDQ